jgi:hypothetical protein
MVRTDRRALPPVTPPPAVMRSAQVVRRGVEQLHRSLALPLVRLLDQTIAMVDVQATGAFAQLGVADVLQHGERTAEEAADELGVDADALDRLLRYLATRGVVRRHGDRFGLTAVSDLLRVAHPQSMRDWVCFQASAWQWHAWEDLAEGVRDPSRTPFERAHGDPFFAHVQADAAAGTQFDAAMRSTSRLQASLLADALDLSGVGTICDVGGGTGTALARLVTATPGLRGVLFDLPSVLARAPAVLEAEGVADRVEVVPGDMFTAVPPGADRYLLSAGRTTVPWPSCVPSAPRWAPGRGRWSWSWSCPITTGRRSSAPTTC